MFTGLESPVHLIFLFLLFLLLFGAKRLPEIGRSLGTGLREFKQSISSEPAPRALDAAASPNSPAATADRSEEATST